METKTILQLGGLLLASWCAKVACTPPTPPPSEEEKKGYTALKKNDSMLVPISVLPTLAQMFIHLNNMTDALALIARDTQWHELLTFFPSRILADDGLTLLQPGRLTGLALMLAGTLIRIDCYTRLQRNFTFELAVKSDHKLVTDGSYAYVRHPSYTGALFVSFGAFLLNYGRGSFWAEHALPDRSLWTLVGVVDVVLKLVFFTGALKRCRIEDDVLKAHFEDQWVQWSKKTPYRMVPFVY